MQDLLTQFKAARRVSTPLIAVRTPDPSATILSILAGMNGDAPPVLEWDIVRGLRGRNEEGVRALAAVVGQGGEEIVNPTVCLETAAKLPKLCLLFMHNAHRYADDGPFVQAVCNLRDLYKMDWRTLVLLCPAITLPAELAQDVLVLDEALPDAERLAEIVAFAHDCAQLPAPDADTSARAVDALCGLAAFPAEQATAMSLTKNGLDVAALWERKRQMVEQTPGLSISRGDEDFESVGGVANVKTFLRRVLAGNEPPRAVVFIDEIEKAIGGAGGDTSGVSQSLLGTLLSWMQDSRANGCIFIGPPGCSKSMVAKAAGNAGGVPTIAFDMTGMKDSLVGASEQRLRNALNVVQAVSQGRALFVATCNSIGVLPPELRRRFTFGTFFFDLPDAEERDIIWSLYIQQFGIDPQDNFPHEAGWTGAEIRQCCELAYRLNCSLTEAATYITPVCVSAAEQIAALRAQAHGRFVSASYAGLYDSKRNAPPAEPTARRVIALEN